jgi:lipoprotein-anchoring transpeptidase ErfK/SrfK
LLERINQVKDTRIWAGMNLKVIKGPFHAVVDKTDYLMDVYLNDDKGNKVFVATYPIGLGEQDSTPIGTWRVRPGSKVTNPSWADPRTGKVFQPDDPDNPIGEYWIGLQGTSENTRDKQGYGIHGTTEAQSIGQQMSMGCIRMRADDLVWVYYMMVDGDSTVTIRR